MTIAQRILVSSLLNARAIQASRFPIHVEKEKDLPCNWIKWWNSLELPFSSPHQTERELPLVSQ